MMRCGSFSRCDLCLADSVASQFAKQQQNEYVIPHALVQYQRVRGDMGTVSAAASARLHAVEGASIVPKGEEGVWGEAETFKT